VFVKSIREDTDLVKLVEAMQFCSVGDLSELHALLFDEGEPEGLTNNGSANHRLWNLLAQRGWLKEETTAPVAPAKNTNAKEFDIVQFKLVPEGRIPIYQLLVRFGPLSSGRANPAKSSNDMLKEMSSRVQEFARSDILVPMSYAGVDTANILTMFSYLLAKGVSDLGNVESKLGAVDTVALQAKNLLESGTRTKN
jgi:hypothetical protein